MEFFRMYRAAFPDVHMHVEDVLPSGDKVVARMRATGTHEGEFMGMPATGKSIDVQFVDIIRFGDDGLAREHWGVFDAMSDDAAARRYSGGRACLDPAAPAEDRELDERRDDDEPGGDAERPEAAVEHASKFCP